MNKKIGYFTSGRLAIFLFINFYQSRLSIIKTTNTGVVAQSTKTRVLLQKKTKTFGTYLKTTERKNYEAKDET